MSNASLTIAGTFGVLVFDAQRPVAMGLSCHHVLVTGTGAAGDVIARPQSNMPTDVAEPWSAGTLAWTAQSAFSTIAAGPARPGSILLITVVDQRSEEVLFRVQQSGLATHFREAA